MEEESIVLATEESFDVDVEEVVSAAVDSEDLEQDIEITETVETVETEVPEEIIIEMEESVGWVGGDSTNHYSLYGRSEPNQHTIGAITGLRDELDEIERLKTAYSDKINVANYYEWEDGAYYEYGYFVSIVPGTSKIKICDGSDIFGVSVDGAGFIGGQDEIVPRNNSYGLIATSGLVDVRCELGIEVGDHVVSNTRGVAQKSESNYGYKVVAKEVKNGVEYVVIALGVQADVMDAISKDLVRVKNIADMTEQKLVSAVNVANQAYNKSLEASESSSVSEEAVKKALESILKSEEKIEEFEKVVDSVSVASAQAKTIANNAVVSATSLKNEAVSRANEAWSKADNVETEVYSLCAKIDKYSVGEYSQAYGLTYEQALKILEIGMIYVPTKHIDSDTHDEAYPYEKDDGKLSYKREFSPGYLYRWDYTGDGYANIGWLTIGESPSVWFSHVEPPVTDRLEYWYTNSDEITDVDGNIGTYEPYTLYKWEEGHWLAVATLKGNISNRAVSEIYQTTNEIALTLNNARGSLASIDARLKDTESNITNTTQWTKGSDEFGNALLYNLATIEQKADDGGSSIALAVADVNGNKVINGANIVLGQNNEDSYIRLSADYINFEAKDYRIHASKIVLDGETSFTTSEDGVTKINGANISTGSIKAESLAADFVTAIEIKASQIVSGEIDASKIKVKNIDASQITTGTIGSDVIYAGKINASQITVGEDGKLGDDVKQAITNITETTLTTTKVIASSLQVNAANITGTFEVKQDYYVLLRAKDGEVKIGNFDVKNNSSASYISSNKTKYNDNQDGVYLGTDGIGLGKGSFFVKSDGSLFASQGNIAGLQMIPNSALPEGLRTMNDTMGAFYSEGKYNFNSRELALFFDLSEPVTAGKHGCKTYLSTTGFSFHIPTTLGERSIGWSWLGLYATIKYLLARVKALDGKQEVWIE